MNVEFDRTNSDVFDHPSSSPTTSRENDQESVVALLSVENNESPKKTFADVGIQIKSGNLVTDFCDVIRNEKELNTLTGIVSYDILNTILDIFKDGFPTYESERMHLRSKVIMTLVKLKPNLSYAILTVLFKCSSESLYTAVKLFYR